MLRLSKAQAMIEYLIYFGISMLVFLSLLSFLFMYEQSEVTQVKYATLTDRATDIQSMFLTFSQMTPTFIQDVVIEETINGADYNFSILSSNLYLIQDDLEVILPLPEIIGDTTNKSFTVTVLDSGVYLS